MHFSLIHNDDLKAAFHSNITSLKRQVFGIKTETHAGPLSGWAHAVWECPWTSHNPEHRRPGWI